MAKFVQQYSNEDYQYMINHYYDMSSSQISKHIGCSRQLVLKIWRENGLKGKPLSRRYYFNEHYFDIIDNQNKAYIIGFLASDGNLYKRKGHLGQIQITLKDNDIHILEQMKIETEYNNKPILHNDKKHSCTLTWNSDIMFNALIDIGLYPNKTTTINTSNINIPVKYEMDYIRGYFDGDGSIYKHLSNTCINMTECNYNIAISGYIHNLSSIQNILNKYNITSNIIKDKREYNGPNKFGQITIANIKSKYFFLKLIYNNSNMFLKRKYEIAKEFIEKVETNIKYKNIVKEYNAVYGQNSQKSIDD